VPVFDFTKINAVYAIDREVLSLMISIELLNNIIKIGGLFILFFLKIAIIYHNNTILIN